MNGGHTRFGAPSGIGGVPFFNIWLNNRKVKVRSRDEYIQLQ